ncbi:hypothetical protein ACFL9U_18220 [Thermodesulfobacteriota bacterium]
MEELTAKAMDLITLFGLKVLAAAVVFIIGRWIAKLLKIFTRKMLDRGQVDPTLSSFVVNLTYIALLVFVILAALGQLGIQTTSSNSA